jgi:glucosamine--fructose-6-phosphate aminotransferase (isomerizing)
MSRDEVAVVHNGIIENHEELREKLKGLGYHFESETDTEVIVHLVHHHYYQNRNLLDAVRQTVAELQGAYAIGVIAKDSPHQLVCARKGSPLIIGMGIEEHFIASDASALLPVTQRLIYLEDGDIADLGLLHASIYNRKGEEITRAVHVSELTADMAELGHYRHYMQKEIHEQPRALTDTLQTAVMGSTLSPALFGPEAEATLSRVKAVTILACGTSYHAGRVAGYWLESIAGIPTNVEIASEYRYRDTIPNPDALIVTISQSGETADTLAALRLAREKARAVLAVTNNANSSMARAADGVLDLHAGPEIGVAATKTFVGQMAALALFALAFAQARGALSEEDSLALVQELQRVPLKMDRVLGGAAAIERAARRYLACEHYLFLGRWINFPIALEGALKLKEISYTHAEGYAGGEMKHGPIALIDEGMTTLAVVPRDRVHEKMLSNMAEVQARGGRILAVAFDGDAKAAASAEETFLIPETHDLFTPFLTVLPLQLFAYHSAAAKGLDVDQPRNLAKSVTVE